MSRINSLTNIALVIASCIIQQALFAQSHGGANHHHPNVAVDCTNLATPPWNGLPENYPTAVKRFNSDALAPLIRTTSSLTFGSTASTTTIKHPGGLNPTVRARRSPRLQRKNTETISSTGPLRLPRPETSLPEIATMIGPHSMAFRIRTATMMATG